MNMVYNYAITPCLPPYMDFIERKDASLVAPCPEMISFWKQF